MTLDVLVLGGTGFVGRALCRRLVESGRGGRITVPTRRLPHGRALGTLPTVDLVEADVHDAGQLKRLVAGHGAVINLVAILHGSEAAFQKVHVDLPERLAQSCIAAGVKRVLHVSALGVASNAPSRYLRSKAAGEAALREAGLELTILRPSVIFGAEDQLLNLFARLQAVLPLVALAGSQARLQPVWVGDVASALVRCLAQPQTIGQVIECAGPREYTLSELVHAAGRWSGHDRPQWPLPDWLGRMQALLLEMLPGVPLMSRDNLDSLGVPNVASGGLPDLASLGIAATELAAVAPQYLGADGRLDALRRAAGRS